MYRNSPPLCTIVLQIPSLMPLKMRKVQLRPGRFDWEIHFPYPNQADREDILIKTARKLQTLDPLPHIDIAAKSEGWSAAELAAILTEAALLAVEDGRREIREEDYIGGYQRRSRYRELFREVRSSGGGG